MNIQFATIQLHFRAFSKAHRPIAILHLLSGLGLASMLMLLVISELQAQDTVHVVSCFRSEFPSIPENKVVKLGCSFDDCGREEALGDSLYWPITFDPSRVVEVEYECSRILTAPPYEWQAFSRLENVTFHQTSGFTFCPWEVLRAEKLRSLSIRADFQFHEECHHAHGTRALLELKSLEVFGGSIPSIWKQLKNLEALSLNDVESQSVNNMDALILPFVKRLELSDMSIHNLGSHLEQNQQLESLKICRVQMNKTTRLSGILASLKFLELVMDTNVVRLFEQVKVPKLESFEAKITNYQDFPQLLFTSKGIQKLRLEGKFDIDLNLPWRRISTLREVSLTSKALNPNKALLALHKSKELKVLGVYSDQVLDRPEKLTFSHLEKLFLGCPVKDMNALAKAVATLPMLKVLLIEKPLHPEVPLPLALFSNPSLQSLEIRSNVILPQFVPSTCGLKKLVIRGGQILNRDVIENWKDSLPDLKIVEHLWLD